MNPLAIKTLLIVDDEQDVRETLSEALELSGYQSSSVSNGEEALKALMRPEKPSLILLDLMMPVMDGLEFMKAKELIPELVDIPVIIISADLRAESKIAGFKVAGYIRKPISLDNLLKTVARYCD